MVVKRPRAVLRVLAQPHLGRDVIRVEVECPASVTGLTQVPVDAIGLTRERLVTVAAYTHDERCGACSVEDVLARGDQQLRQAADELWPKIEAALAARAMQTRRN